MIATEELQERLVGPEGTEVIYTVVRDDELVEVTMVREQMAALDEPPLRLLY